MPWLLWLFLYIHYSTAAQKLKSICLRTHVHNTTCHIRVSFWRMQLFECDIILVYESMTNVVKRTTLTHLFNEWPIFNASDGVCTSCWPSFASKWHSILTASITTSNLLSLIKSKSLAFGLSSVFFSYINKRESSRFLEGILNVFRPMLLYEHHSNFFLSMGRSLQLKIYHQFSCLP